MARLRRVDPRDVDGDYGGFSSLSAAAGRKPAVRTSPRKKAAQVYQDCSESSDMETTEDRELRVKSPPKSTTSGKQRRLAPRQLGLGNKALQEKPLLFPPGQSRDDNRRDRPATTHLQSPRKKLALTQPLSTDSDPEETVEVDIEESMWCGSDASSSESEDELPSPRKFLQFRGNPTGTAPATVLKANSDGLDLAQRLQAVSLNDTTGRTSTLQKPEEIFSTGPHETSRPGSSSDKENSNAILRFSPPRLHSPAKQKQPARPVTPPQSPSKSRLQSPTKTKAKVPSPKVRQSLDAFWNAETVNDWNDQYSPRKTLKSPKKLGLPRTDSSTPTISSPHKVPSSPTKRTKAEREAKQAFEDKKHALAETFLIELDDTITAGQIRTLAASTGGVRLLWSKTLNTTAGRANWRRETTKLRNLDGTTTTHQDHHASIELAEKVIDDEHRLLNVLAHEFCHLANFMISGIKDQPHGAQFKAWGRKVSAAFAARGVQVTTKHEFEIEYRYIWRCEGEECGSEFRRHSKSIDPRRQRCGQCRGKLVQVKPTPRSTGVGKDGGKEGFAAYVKLHFAKTKTAMPPGSSQKAVMEALGKAYRAEKAKGGASESGDGGGVERLVAELEVVEIVDD